MNVMNLFTATMVAASIMAATVGIGGKYAYNVKSEGEFVTEQTVYKLDDSRKYLTRHLKYTYEYDNQNRLIAKTTLRWNSLSEKWENSSQLVYSYNEDSCSLEYARWNKKTKDFTDVTERVLYSLNAIQQVSVYQGFKLNEKTNEWYMVKNHEISIPQWDLYWFASK